MARCAVRAAFSGATWSLLRRVREHSYSPLNAGWDGAARHPYLTVVVSRHAGAHRERLNCHENVPGADRSLG
jgi:hypothetical protein